MVNNKITIPVYFWTIDNQGLKVIRQKTPRFVALYQNDKLNIIEWIDEECNNEKTLKMLKKAEIFLKYEYFEK